jgi:hypothetical protein
MARFPFCLAVVRQRRGRGGNWFIQGLVYVTWQIEADNMLLRWEERKEPGIEKMPTSEGFGRMLVRRTIVGQLGGELADIWEAGSTFISIPMERLSS